MSFAVEGKNIVKDFGSVRALDGLNFEIKEGEIFGLIGLNGAGKTTALRITSTLLLPTSGTITVFGHDVIKEASEVRSLISYLPEEAGAYKNLSARGIKPEFVGYGTLTADSKILVMVADGHEITEAGPGQQLEVVTEATPFYAEAGGQVGDAGTITGSDFEMAVLDTIKDPTGLTIHKGKVISGQVKKGAVVSLNVDGTLRQATALNHTATHILHAVLRKVLGEHVKQAGSLVAPDRLRFDFTHFSLVDSDTLDTIERLVNRRIRENMVTGTQEMDADDAFKSGATALFEEKYGDRVRVVSLADFSKELCGGTHTDRTGNIGLFRIVSESSVSSGVRRIEAVTGEEAVAYTQKAARILQDTAHLLKENVAAVPGRVQKMISGIKALEKEVDHLKTKLAAKESDASRDTVQSINGVKMMVQKVSVDTPAALRNLADQFKDKIKSGIVVLGSTVDAKVMLIAVVTKDLTDRYHAGNIITRVAAVVGGRGGGRPDMAQAGGNQPQKLNQALEKAYKVVEQMTTRNDE